MQVDAYVTHTPHDLRPTVIAALVALLPRRASEQDETLSVARSENVDVVGDGKPTHVVHCGNICHR